MAEVPAVAAIAEGSDRHGRFALLNGTGLLGLYMPDQRSSHLSPEIAVAEWGCCAARMAKRLLMPASSAAACLEGKNI